MYNVGNQRTNVTRTGENYANYTNDAIGQVIGDQAYEVSGGAARLNEQLHYGFDAAGNLNYRTSNALIENFQVNNLNELTNNTNGGTLTVMGTTTSQATNVTVNGTTASNYNDATFAAPNMPLTTNYTAIASDSLGRHSTNTVSVSIATNNASFQYDGNGNLTNDGLRSFAYDDENQLIQVWVNNQWLSQFAYDGKMRRRIRQECAWQNGAWVQTNEVYYVYDGNLVIQERNVNNLPTTTYTRGKDLSGSLQGAGGIGGLLSMTLNTELGPSSSNSMFYHSDGNGNVTMIINSSQAIVAKYLYDAFGNTLSAAGSLAQANLYRFSSKEAHPSSGLVYYLYRYYDPNLQRWPNRDPIQERGGKNLYAFWENDLINNLDAAGLQGTFINPVSSPFQIPVFGSVPTSTPTIPVWPPPSPSLLLLIYGTPPLDPVPACIARCMKASGANYGLGLAGLGFGLGGSVPSPIVKPMSPNNPWTGWPSMFTHVCKRIGVDIGLGLRQLGDTLNPYATGAEVFGLSYSGGLYISCSYQCGVLGNTFWGH